MGGVGYRSITLSLTRIELGCDNIKVNNILYINIILAFFSVMKSEILCNIKEIKVLSHIKHLYTLLLVKRSFAHKISFIYYIIIS